MHALSTNLYLYVRSLLENEEGQDLVEYALVVALIAFGAITGMGSLPPASTMPFPISPPTLTSKSRSLGPSNFLHSGTRRRRCGFSFALGMGEVLARSSGSISRTSRQNLSWTFVSDPSSDTSSSMFQECHALPQIIPKTGQFTGLVHSSAACFRRAGLRSSSADFAVLA